MALENGNGNGSMYMPVAPAYMGGNNGGFGLGGDWGWIVLLLLLAGNGGWGFGGMGGFGGFGGYDFPWILNGQQNINNNTNNGFRDAMLNDGINGIRDGVSGISTQLCNGFASVNAGVANGFAQAEIAENGRQMANMNQMFSLQSALQNCCCENRAATADLKYTLATEACATRTANTANTQAILDKLCQLELDGYKRENDNLRSQLSDAKIAASQTAQNAFIAQGLNNEVDALYNRLSSCPVPTTPVYGRTPIFTCGGTQTGCGCGGVA